MIGITESRMNQLCSIAAQRIGCNWNDFDVIYCSQNSILVVVDRLVVNQLQLKTREFLIEVSQ